MNQKNKPPEIVLWDKGDLSIQWALETSRKLYQKSTQNLKWTQNSDSTQNPPNSERFSLLDLFKGGIPNPAGFPISRPPKVIKS